MKRVFLCMFLVALLAVPFVGQSEDAEDSDVSVSYDDGFADGYLDGYELGLYGEPPDRYEAGRGITYDVGYVDGLTMGGKHGMDDMESALGDTDYDDCGCGSGDD